MGEGRGWKCSAVPLKWLAWRTSYFTLADTWSAWHISNSPRCCDSDQGGYLRSERETRVFWRSECKWRLQRDRLSQCSAAQLSADRRAVPHSWCKRLSGSLTWNGDLSEDIMLMNCAEGILLLSLGWWVCLKRPFHVPFIFLLQGPERERQQLCLVS